MKAIDPKTCELKSKESNLLSMFKNTSQGEMHYNTQVDRVDHSRVTYDPRESGNISGLFDKAIDKIRSPKASHRMQSERLVTLSQMST